MIFLRPLTGGRRREPLLRNQDLALTSERDVRCFNTEDFTEFLCHRAQTELFPSGKETTHRILISGQIYPILHVHSTVSPQGRNSFQVVRTRSPRGARDDPRTINGGRRHRELSYG